MNLSVAMLFMFKHESSKSTYSPPAKIRTLQLIGKISAWSESTISILPGGRPTIYARRSSCFYSSASRTVGDTHFKQQTMHLRSCFSIYHSNLFMSPAIAPVKKTSAIRCKHSSLFITIFLWSVAFHVVVNH